MLLLDETGHTIAFGNAKKEGILEGTPPLVNKRAGESVYAGESFPLPCVVMNLLLMCARITFPLLITLFDIQFWFEEA